MFIFYIFIFYRKYFLQQINILNLNVSMVLLSILVLFNLYLLVKLVMHSFGENGGSRFSRVQEIIFDRLSFFGCKLTFGK